MVARTCLTLTLYLHCLSLVVYFHLKLGSTIGLFLSAFRTTILRAFIFPMHATCPVYLSLVHSIRLVIYDERYEHCCSLLCTNTAAPHYVRTVLLLITQFPFQLSLQFLSVRCKYFCRHPALKHLVCILSSAWETGISRALELLTITVPLYLPLNNAEILRK